MDKQQAQKIIKDTFEHSFDMDRFTVFIKNLLNRIDESKAFHAHGYVKEGFRGIIKTYERIGTYNSTDDKEVDIIVVYLQKGSSLDHARVTQRNFAGRYLDDRGGKDAGLFAFVSPDEADWRFSLVKMDYKFDKNGKVKEEFTPARRWSFLVGENEKSHTAQSSLVKILANDEQAPTLKEIENAFDIETVTKEFFREYRNLFLRTKDELDNVVNKDPKIRADFEAKGIDTVNFAKKLLGQIVFLYFLQKKGWFGAERDANWGDGSKHFLRELFKKKHGDYNNFFNDILEPLFYEALRNDRSHDDGYYSRFDCKIPFLNGGLFDPIGNYDWVHTDIIIPDRLFSNNVKTKEGDTGTGILDVFNRYNFTVKEDEPLEKEVAIDPELLGKSYEKFNAIRPDNYDEFRKALQSGKTGEENKFNKKFGVYYTPREIVHYMCQQSLINYLNTQANEAKLPFPINKTDLDDLIEVGELISEHEATALIKQGNIKNGTQKSSEYTSFLSESIRENAKAIDEWLAEISVCDPAVGSGAFPVGMMSEIVKTRNVLSIFLNDKERTTYEFKRRCIEHSLHGVDIDPGAVEIAKLRLWLSLVVDEEDIRNIKPLPNLDYKIVCGNSLLGVEKDLFNFQRFNKLEELKPLFFNETNPTKKEGYKKQIDGLISQITNGHKEFDFEVYFSEVFHQKGGFDVVIANPPYKILTKNNTDARELNILIKTYNSIKRSYSKNIFTLFIERGIRIDNPCGILTFIVPEGLFKTRSYSDCVKELKKTGSVKAIVTFTDFVFENVITGNIIFLFLKNRQEKTLLYHFDKNYVLKAIKEKVDPVIAKISNSQTVYLKNICSIFKGMVVKDRESVISAYESDGKDIFLLGKSMSKWRINKKYSTDYHKLKIVGGTKKIEKHRHFPRILIRRTGANLCCSLLCEPALTESTLYSCWSLYTDLSDKYLISLLNAKLLDYYIKRQMITNEQAFPQVLMTDIENLPIKKIDLKAQQPFVMLVDQILAITKDDDFAQNPQKQAKVKALEAEIDQLVYKLYDLTPEEIKIVEGENAEMGQISS